MARRSFPWIFVALALVAVGLFWRGRQLRALRRATAPSLRPAKCPFPLPPDVYEGASALCFSLRLGPGLKVFGVVLEPQLEATPVFLLAGSSEGPGEAFLPSLDASGRRTRFGARPVIYLERRGIGASGSGFECTADPSPTACLLALRGQDFDFEAFGTSAAAADVVRVADGLAMERFLLAGAGDGSRLGLEVLRQVPHRIEGAFFESVVPPGGRGLEARVTAGDAALTELMARCRVASECPPPVDLEAAVLALETPIVTRFGTVEGHELTELLFRALEHADLAGLVPAALRAAAERRSEAIGRFAGAVRRRQRPGAPALNLFILCTEQAPRLELEALQRRISALPPRLRPWLGRVATELMLCPELGFPRATLEPPPHPSRAEVPVLILAPTIDITSTPELAEAMAMEYARSTLIRLPGRTRSPALTLHSPRARVDVCAAGLLRRFLSAPQDPVDTSCTRDRPPLRFFSD